MRIARARARARDATRLDANRTGAAAAPRLKKIDPNASLPGSAASAEIRGSADEFRARTRAP